MTVKEMVANALYQRYCEEQLMFAYTWAELPADRKHVWMGVAGAALGFSMETLREVKPWQARERDTERAA